MTIMLYSPNKEYIQSTINNYFSLSQQEYFHLTDRRIYNEKTPYNYCQSNLEKYGLKIENNNDRWRAVCLTVDGEMRTGLSKSIVLRIHSKSKLMQFCALGSAVSFFDWPFTGSVPIRAFALGTNFWNFFVPSYPLMSTSFTCAFSDGYFFYSHRYRIVVPIFKITYSVLSKVKFIYS